MPAARNDRRPRQTTPRVSDCDCLRARAYEPTPCMHATWPREFCFSRTHVCRHVVLCAQRLVVPQAAPTVLRTSCMRSLGTCRRSMHRSAARATWPRELSLCLYSDRRRVQERMHTMRLYPQQTARCRSRHIYMPAPPADGNASSGRGGPGAPRTSEGASTALASCTARPDACRKSDRVSSDSVSGSRSPPQHEPIHLPGRILEPPRAYSAPYHATAATLSASPRPTFTPRRPA